MRLQRGQLVQHLRIVGVLGEGATAIVYLVEDTANGDEKRALKLLSVLGASYRKRLKREAAAAGLVSHENVVGIHGLIDHDGYQGVLMDYIEGPTLYHWQQAHLPSIDEALALSVGILRGVQALHDAGLVHRDLKPSNVMLGPNEQGGVVPKLVDFGLIKETDLRDRMTVTGVAMGTPTYMAPEQLRDASRVDHRADIYSLGCIMFELLTGHPPFRRDDWWGTYRAVEQGTKADLSDLPTGLPEGVRDLIGSMLEPEQQDRPESAKEILALLAKHLGEADPCMSGMLWASSEGAAAVRDLVSARSSALSRSDLWQGDALDAGDIHLPTGNMEQLTTGAPTTTLSAERRRDWIPMAAIAVAAIVIVSVMAWMLVSTPGVTGGEVARAGDEGQTETDPQPVPDVAGADDAGTPDDSEDTDARVAVEDGATEPDPGERTLGSNGAGSLSATLGGPGSRTGATSGTAEDGTSAGSTTAEGTADDIDEGTDDTDVPAGPEPAVAIVTGEVAEVLFIGPNGERARVGDPLLPGAWQVHVRWTAGGPLARATQMQAREGETVTLSCDPGFYACNAVSN